MAAMTRVGNALTIPVGSLPAGGRRLHVEMKDTKVAPDSFEVMFFLNLPPDEAERAGPDHPRYLGSLTMFGSGGGGYGDFGYAPEQEMGDVQLTTDLMEPTDPAAARPDGNQLTVVLMGLDGSVVSPEKLKVGSLSVKPVP
jgi:hypothetical protein